MSKVQKPIIPERFQVARPTLIFDRFMNHFIKVGGLSIILAVCLIFVFILIQIWPLFAGAKVEAGKEFSLTDEEYISMGIDEYGEFPFFVSESGEFHFLDTTNAASPHHRGLVRKSPGFGEDVNLNVFRYNARNYEMVLGTDDGRFSAVKINYRATYPAHGGREVRADLDALPLLPIGVQGMPIESIDYGDSGTRKLAVAVQRVDGQPQLHAVSLSQARTLFGVGEIQVDRSYNLTHLLTGDPVDVMVTWEADSVVVLQRNGAVSYLFYERGEFYERQNFKPFADLQDPTVASMDFILGDVSVVFTSVTGEMRVFSLFRDPETNSRRYGQTKTFPALDSGAEFFSISLRNKAFLVGTGNFASLRYMTTEKIRWEGTLPFEPKLALIGPRYDRLVFLDKANALHFYDLKDSHPIAGWKTYFGKIQYEGQSEPTYSWQSTGGRDDFERKLSLVPLILGTLKGTVYAMFFAVPIALLGALYTSQFLRPEFKRFVKPTMEIMASLPSVVLGFLAALWLAPIVSNAVPSVVLAVIGMIVAAVSFGYGWERIPSRYRMRVPPGYEFLIITPFIILFCSIGWSLGPVMERMFFVVTDPDTGVQVADFRLWYPNAIGLAFEQRNAFVVGFVMGFAVIPIIFTISEDSLSNVPEAFRSGSLALGASRWQTAVRIVLPTASAGIFSALMIGLGRAVGETMIVVMATGNVPVTEFNPFTGMRTLSANIAVELPEAPYLGTLYRTLFLGAMVLFLMTFTVNTFAEILRQRLRERYRAVE